MLSAPTRETKLKQKVGELFLEDDVLKKAVTAAETRSKMSQFS
jgi:hypothetical protein